jgi:diacylglycerol kinase (ATP)
MSKYKSKNLMTKLNHSLDGFNASIQDYSVRLAYFISLPVSIFFFVLAPDLKTKLLSSFIFLFWIVFESLNTSLETIVDRISMKKHPLSKIAKDIPSFINAIIVLFFIFAIIMLSFITKYGYEDWKDLNRGGTFCEYISQSFKN